MKLYGTSVLKGLMYTFKTFVNTYIEDFRRLSGKNGQEEEHGLRSYSEGVVTVQYPENPMSYDATYERFRVLPMLIYDEKEDGERDIRCTSCGICAKVCPPQCIWIVQETDEKGKPKPRPVDFSIDMSVCMNCGMCTEFCPFDAIKMDHKFELNQTEKRRENYLYGMEELLQPTSYYAGLHPKANAAEEEARRIEAEAKAAKEKAKKEAAAKKAAKAKKEAAEAGDAGEAKAKKADDPERAARIAAAKEKAAAAKAKKEAEKAAGGEKAEDPERAAKIAAAKEKAAAAKAKKEAEKAAAEKGEAAEQKADSTEKTAAVEANETKPDASSETSTDKEAATLDAAQADKKPEAEAADASETTTKASNEA